LAIHRQYIHKVTFRGAKTGNNPTDRSKLGAKRHILTEKTGIPLSVVISPASTHDIKQVTEVVDKTIIKRPPSSSKSKNKRRQQQHLCLDKGYKSAEDEQKLIKRGYVLHIPIKKKEKMVKMVKKRWMKKMYQIVRNTLPRDGLSSVLIRGITDSENFSQDMKRRLRTTLG
jgi:hypothetical protein